MRQNFELVAGDDVEIRESDQRETREWQLLSEGTGGFRQQGMYVMSSAGTPLGYVNRGWPDPDPVAILKLLKDAAANYRRLPTQERILAQALDPDKDRMKFEEEAFTKPPKTLDLRIIRRGLPYEGMTSFDHRHPMYHHVDRLWFRADEWRSFLPATLRPGETRVITGAARNRIVLLSHMQAGAGAWWVEHITGGQTISKVTSVQGDQIELEITGNYKMKATSQWNNGAYDGNLIIRATFDRAADRFTRFDLAMLGTHDVGTRMDNIHAGSLVSKIAVSAEIAFPDGKDDGRKPTQWKYGYGLPWSRGR